MRVCYPIAYEAVEGGRGGGEGGLEKMKNVVIFGEGFQSQILSLSLSLSLSLLPH